MEGSPPGAFTNFGQLRFIPLTALFFPFSVNIPQFSYQPLSPSPSTTYAADVHPGCRSAFRLLSTTFLSSQLYISPLPLIFPLSLSSSFLFYKDFLSPLGTKMNDLYKLGIDIKYGVAILMDGVFFYT
ncbi:hypothetical protein LI328DRAFT_61494 [Trichoderma asperelloides]|nr:hypothetical protein LI328DRAFT_61494 [Trichoderma asperelloides]